MYFPTPTKMKMSYNNESDMSCAPANPRRSWVPGPTSVKLVTEDSTEVGDQAPVSVNASGSTNKKFTQQVFHPSLFKARPRSSSVGNIPIQTPIEKELEETELHQPSHTKKITWQEAKNRKRLRGSPENTSRNQKTKPNYWLATPIPTFNSFSELENTDELNQPESQPIIITKPPPFFIDKVSNIRPLTEMLDKVAQGNYEIKILQNERVKIQAKIHEAYSAIYKELKCRDTEFFTYKTKQERSFRVVLKRIHPSTDIDTLKEALEDLGHKPTNIWNVKNNKTRQPLPIFFIDLQPNSNNKDIYNIKSLLNCRIEIEPPRPKRIIPQCSNCQQYGHTQNFCHRQPKCVKCAGSHHTSKCSRKERSDKVKCILCEGNHPANYKGCTVYKELQKIRFPTPRSKGPQSANKEQQQRKITHESYSKFKYTRDSDMSYAAAVKSDPKTQIHEDNHTNDNENISALLRTFNASMQTLMNQMLKMTQILVDLMSKMPIHTQP